MIDLEQSLIAGPGPNELADIAAIRLAAASGQHLSFVYVMTAEFGEEDNDESM